MTSFGKEAQKSSNRSKMGQSSNLDSPKFIMTQRIEDNECPKKPFV